MALETLETPCLILDRNRLDANIARMRASAERLGVRLRPHLKTAKSIEVARRVGADAITVSTLREAEYFADGGFTDITYAVGIAPGRLDRAGKLVARGVDLKILVDTPDAARAVVESGIAFKVLIEVDCGDGRAGIAPDDPRLLETAAAFGSEGPARLDGVLTHAGHSYGIADADGVARIAEEERQAIVRAADTLRSAGYAINTVSAGSTPTALMSRDATGLTEYRAGVYVFFDMDQQSRGVCQEDDVALSVLTTVIGHNRSAGKVLLDAGGLALSKDTGANAFRPEVGYGAVCDLDARPIDGLFVTSVSQEHGHVRLGPSHSFEDYPVGRRLRVLPNHACMTAAAYESYNILEDGALGAVWGRCNGW